MRNFTGEEISTITSALQRALDYVRQQKNLTEQVSDLLDLLIPGDGHRLFTLGEWHHSPDLAPRIIEWLASTLDGEHGAQPRQSKVLSDEGSMVWVRAEHMLDDHWTICVFSIVLHEAGDEIPEFSGEDPGRIPAMAIARIASGGDRLHHGCAEDAHLS